MVKHRARGDVAVLAEPRQFSHRLRESPPVGRVEMEACRRRRNNSHHSCFWSAGSVVVSSSANDQRVFLRASKVLHHVLACQRPPNRSERFLIHQSHRTPARGVLRATAAVVRPLARTRVSRITGVQRAVRATNDVDEVHALDCSGLSSA